MDSTNRWIHQSPPVPQSNYSFFADQARRAGYVGPELGRTQREHFRGHHHHEHLHPRPHILPQPQPHPCPPFPPYAHDMHEAIQREIEKDRIREEIIMSEIVRRRVLEAEVRRELMMERELALRRGGDGFPFGSSSVVGFDSQMRLPLLGSRAEGRSLEERIVLSPAEGEKLNVRRENGGPENLPFQLATTDLRVSEVNPVSEGAKVKEKIILLAKPNENTSGSKRKAATPPLESNAIDSPADGILKKKAKEEWSCALCQVSATSERGLNEHLRGRKHKSKEAALKAQRAGKNYTIGLLPKKPVKSIQVVGTVDPGADDESLPSKKSGEVSSKQDDPSPLQENHRNSDNLKKKRLVVVHQNAQTNGDAIKKKHRFWCEICQVGAHSLKVMNAHKKGKKHRSRLERIGQNDEAGPSDQKQKIVILMNCAEDCKNVTSEGVDEALAETGSEDHEPVDAVKTEDHEPVDEPEPEDHEPIDAAKPEDHEPVDEPEPDDHEPIDAAKPEDHKPVDEPEQEDHEPVDEPEPEDHHEHVDLTEPESGEATDTTKPDDDLAKPDVADEHKDDEPTVS